MGSVGDLFLVVAPEGDGTIDGGSDAESQV